eukprot:SAG11_NODE_69_length_18453_cov_37.601613_15_plen_46_part_00
MIVSSGRKRETMGGEGGGGERAEEGRAGEGGITPLFRTALVLSSS